MNPRQVGQRLNRLAWQVYEQCSEENEIVVAGIADNGYRLAEKITTILRGISPIRVSLAKLVIDKDNPIGNVSMQGLDVSALEGKTVIVIDDVSNSGRTLMYGVNFFLEFSVKSIHTLVLVDRDHNRFPVKTNFVGLSLATTLQEHISVEVSANGDDFVYLD